MYPVFFELPEWVPLLGGQPITSFGVFMLFAFLTAGYVLRAELRRVGEDPERAWDFVFMAVIGGIVGARGYYVLLNFRSLATDPVGLIFARGGLVWYGGFLLATALVIWEIRRQKLSVPLMADLMAPALALAYAVGRIGCFLVGDDYGRPTESWVGIEFPRGIPPSTAGELRTDFGLAIPESIPDTEVLAVHPTQLYETGLALAIFAVLWRLRKHPHRDGWLFGLWMVLAGAERFAVEFFRAKDDRFFGPFTLAQVISVAVILVGAWVLGRRASSDAGASAGTPAGA